MYHVRSGHTVSLWHAALVHTVNVASPAQAAFTEHCKDAVRLCLPKNITIGDVVFPRDARYLIQRHLMW